ncbi:MAG: hypothetical protein ACTSRA_14590, partial [Promethearchaeota archaeon]
MARKHTLFLFFFSFIFCTNLAQPSSVQSKDLYWGPIFTGFLTSYDFEDQEAFASSYTKLFLDTEKIFFDVNGVHIPLFTYDLSGFLYPSIVGLPNTNPFQSNWYGQSYAMYTNYTDTYNEDGGVHVDFTTGLLTATGQIVTDPLPLKIPTDGDNLHISFGVPLPDTGDYLNLIIDTVSGEEHFDHDDFNYLLEFDVKVNIGKNEYLPYANNLYLDSPFANLYFQNSGQLSVLGTTYLTGRDGNHNAEVFFQGGNLVGYNANLGSYETRYGHVVNEIPIFFTSGTSKIDVFQFENHAEGTLDVDSPAIIHAAGIINEGLITINSDLTIGPLENVSGTLYPLLPDSSMYGSFQNSGTMFINPGGKLIIFNTVNLTGTGKVELQGQITGYNSASKLITDHFIESNGNVLIAGNLEIVNKGTISAGPGDMKFQNVKVTFEGDQALMEAQDLASITFGSGANVVAGNFKTSGSGIVHFWQGSKVTDTIIDPRIFNFDLRNPTFERVTLDGEVVLSPWDNNTKGQISVHDWLQVDGVFQIAGG